MRWTRALSYADLRARRLRARSALAACGHVDFKDVSSAKWVDITRSRTGVIRVQIEHDAIRGVTPQMMRWWFENLAESTTWNGRDFTGPEVTFYHLWHHRDHIAITPLTSVAGTTNRGFQVGQRSRIQEQFNDFNDRINVTVVTTRLDDEEFTFEIKLGRLTVGRIVHQYRSEEAGLAFYAETRIGLKTPVVGWIVNWLGVPLIYSTRSAINWIKHNIEETGRSEDVIPPLYANAHPHPTDGQE